MNEQDEFAEAILILVALMVCNSSISLGPLKHTFWIVAATMGLNSPSRIRKYSLRICFYLKSYDDSVPVRIPKQLHDIRHIQKRIDVPARMHF